MICICRLKFEIIIILLFILLNTMYSYFNKNKEIQGNLSFEDGILTSFLVLCISSIKILLKHFKKVWFLNIQCIVLTSEKNLLKCWIRWSQDLSESHSVIKNKFNANSFRLTLPYPITHPYIFFVTFLVCFLGNEVQFQTFRSTLSLFLRRRFQYYFNCLLHL